MSGHNLGLDSGCWFSRWWLRFDVIEDLLDYVWVNDPKAAPSDDTHGAATQRAHGDIKPISARSKTRLSGSPSRR